MIRAIIEGAVKNRREVDVGVVVLPVFALVALLGLINSYPSIFSNWRIALLQVVFLLYTLLVFRRFDLGYRVYVPLALIAVLVVFSNLLAVRDGAGGDWQRTLEMLAHMGSALAFFTWFYRFPNILAWVVVGLLGSIVVYFFLLADLWLSLDDPAAYAWFSRPPLFRHIRHVGYFLCVGAVVGTWAVLAYSGLLRVLAGCACFLAVAMLLWSGGRGAVLSSFVAVIVLLHMFPLRRHWGAWLALLLGFVLALLVSAAFPVDHPGLGWLSALGRSSESASLDQLSSNRIGIWLYLLDYIAQRPWFGWGGEGFRAVWTGFPIVQAHNVLMQLLIEWGVIATALILGFLLWLTLKGLRLYWQSARALEATDALPLGMALVAVLGCLSLVDGVFYHGMPMAFLMIGYGIVGAAVYRKAHGHAGAHCPNRAECSSLGKPLVALLAGLFILSRW